MSLILAASERLDELVRPLSGETEPRLTFVPPILCTRTCWKICRCSLTAAFPHTEFGGLIGEDEGCDRSPAKSRAQVGLIEARERYPTDTGSTRLPLQTAMGIYVALAIRWRRRVRSPG